MLAEKRCGNGIYDDDVRLEIEEAVHLHYRDFRLIMRAEDFETVAGTFQEADAAHEKMGRPKTMPEMNNLCTKRMGEAIAGKRFAVEQQVNGTIHVHYHDLRIHMSEADFLWMSQEMAEAGRVLSKPNAMAKIEGVDVYVDGVKASYHPVVLDHLKTLRTKTWEGEEHSVLKEKVVKARSDAGHFSTRNMGFPPDYPGDVPQELDEQYLLSLEKDIEAKGLLSPVIAYKYDDGRVYICNSHRLACLIHLGYREFGVHVCAPETGWSQQ
jgi:hypothetical protein